MTIAEMIAMEYTENNKHRFWSGRTHILQTIKYFEGKKINLSFDIHGDIHTWEFPDDSQISIGKMDWFIPEEKKEHNWKE